MSDKKQYYEPLTWLRGIAAFFVVISHSLRATEQIYTGTEERFSNVVVSLLDLGTFGVLLFFTLSGTTLYISNVREGKNLNLSSFYIKRFFRIWPAFFCSLIAYILFALIFSNYYGHPQGNWIEKQFFTPYSVSDVVSYLSFSFNIWGQIGLFNNAYWSLPVEFQYYLVFPLIIYLFRFVGPLSPILFAAALYLIFKYHWHFFADSRFFMLGFTFCGGVFIGYVFNRSCIKVRGTTIGMTAFLSAMLLSVLIQAEMISFGELPLLSNIWISLGLCAILVVFLLTFCEVNLPKPLVRLFMDYGNKSYSVYLYHNLLIGAAVLILIQLQVEQAWLRFALVFLFAAPISYWVATLSYRYIEQPFIEIGRRIAKRNQARGI